MTNEQIVQLVADLDAARFAVRDKASRELGELAELAVPALRCALASRPSPELRLRGEMLLEQVLATKHSRSRLRLGRALCVLEQIGTPQAREGLSGLAKGADEAWLTREAKASLRRLATREEKIGMGA